MQIELGFRAASDLVDELPASAIISDDEINGGRVVVVNALTLEDEGIDQAPAVIYLCTDAQAWGTISTFASIQDALHSAAGILQLLRDTAPAE